MIGRAFACALALAIAAPHAAVIAQDAAEQSAVLTVDPERMFADSRFGKASVARLEAAQQDLLSENKKLEAALEAEEKDLTDRRPGLPAAEFRKLADAFNAKAEQIRNARLAKSRSLTGLRDEDRQKFLNAVIPILGDLMGEMGALVILDKKTVFLSFERVDVTDRAIARIDTVLDENLQPKPAAVDPPNPAPAP
jgi:Skp family chaperone for outer membrane proteins